jgi:hypothetical protein
MQPGCCAIDDVIVEAEAAMKAGESHGSVGSSGQPNFF